MKTPLTRNAWIFLAIIILAQILFRAWFFPEHLFFHAEQARDHLIVERAWQEGEWITIGPLQAGTGGIKLGPLYYYQLLGALLPFDFHPIGGVVLVSLLWITTTALVFWYLYSRGRPTLAMIFTLLLITSEYFFVFTSYALNMNVIFFYEAVFLITLIEYIRSRKPALIFISFSALAFLLQSHLSAVTILPFLAILFIIYRKKLTWHAAVAPLIPIASFIPVMFYDSTRGWPVTRTFFKFLIHPSSSTPLDAHVIPVIHQLEVWLTSVLVFHRKYLFLDYTDPRLQIPFLILGAVVVGIALYKLRPYLNQWKALSQHPTLCVLLIYTLCIFAGTIVVQSITVRHFILIAFIPLLLIALGLEYLWKHHKRIGRAAVTLFLAAFLALNIFNGWYEFRIGSELRVNEPYEGLSADFPEQHEIATEVAHQMDQEEIRALIRTSEPTNALGITMRYLIEYQLDDPSLLIRKGEQHRATHVLYIAHQTALAEFEPILRTEHFQVYLIKKKQYDNHIKQHEEQEIYE